MSLIKYIFLYKKEGNIYFMFLLIGMLSGFWLNALFGLIVCLTGTAYFGVAVYAAYKDFQSDKDIFEKYMVDAWAQDCTTEEEIKRRQDLLLTSGHSAVFEEYVSPYSGISFDDYISNPTEFTNIFDNPIFDLSNPFNANYGTGHSAYELNVGITPDTFQSDSSSLFSSNTSAGLD